MSKTKFKQFLYPFAPDGIYDKKSRIQYTDPHSTLTYADACIRFLKRQADGKQPFYAYIAFESPHYPRQAPPEFRERYEDADEQGKYFWARFKD